ncbi:hypothetical protein LWI28_027527 [Acer negundo]|uniref:CRM domain-containing protein n=1 Tax=Acer negundo TaxID=4023 RepID=A0AAD5I8E9_ACENE|nr:hypothetical protein LWI28_027527 [Acer negundo]KAK4833373.1 hypothetical protein QYF36_003675 [Acer negundo]
MLLSLYFHNPILPPKSLKNPSSTFLTSHKTLTLQSHSKSSKFLIQCSTPQTPRTNNHSQTRTRNQNRNFPKSPIQRIADKLRSLGIVEEKTRDKTLKSEPETETGDKTSAGEIFIPLPDKIPKYRVGHTIDASWSTPENPVPEPGSGSAIVRYNEIRNEVKKQEALERKTKEKKEALVPTLAELKLSQEELRRLRTLGIELRKKLKVGKAGITEGIVNGIHERWRNVEVVKIVCEDICRLNMKRTHDLLEMKTGGLVVWRSGSKIILYRGPNYKYPYFLSDQSSMHDASPDGLPNQHADNGELDKLNGHSSGMDGVKSPVPSPTNQRAQPALIRGVGSPDKVRFQQPGEAELAEEADRLLDGLGPRFTDWWGYDPQPVDADLLPAIVPGYRRPFRLLPYGVQPKLTNDEMTTLRRLGRPLPCHFALSRNRKLQGLADAIVKLWEKCEIAKIAVKRGVQNTNSELMTEELKWLTGGTLLARDREFIVLYRGKDFLPSAVSSAIEERRKHVIFSEKQRIEFDRSNKAAEKLKLEKRRIEFNTSSEAAGELKLGSIQSTSGDIIESKSDDKFGGANDQKSFLQSEQKKIGSSEEAIRRTNIKLYLALEKKDKAEKLLAELEKANIPQQPELDKEGITEEERYMLRKVGLRMKAFLLMGRRGIFDGTVENMHLHWKYRELVKIISKQNSMEAARQEAQILETESGGILVSVERVSKGYAIIVYRGKNYERPACLRPKTLLTKRQAMKRSLEAQRRQSLKLHVLELAKNIDKLKFQLAKDEEAKTMQSVDESILPLVKEDMGNIESARCVTSDSELESGQSSHSVVPTSSGVNVEVREEHGADSASTESNQPMDAMIDSLQAIKQDDPVDLSSTYKETIITKSEIESSSESQEEKSHSVVGAENCPSSDEPIRSEVESAKNGSEPVSIVIEKGRNEMASRPVNLSNRDRLLLRKQALRMRKRPVLAVGRSNIVTGVAKTIKSHFEKHPLAIVSVKGRAKGTSVQEVVSKLQEATGAALVSQEPSKVILYRGWGADEEYVHSGEKNKRSKTSVRREVTKSKRLPHKSEIRALAKDGSGSHDDTKFTLELLQKMVQDHLMIPHQIHFMPNFQHDGPNGDGTQHK